jgi:hypothetical protein
MTMISKAFAAVIAATILSAAARAEDATTPETADARYSFHKVADGFLRLDKQTGEVAMCGPQAVGWACVAAPEDRAVLENEIERLRKDNAALKEDLLAHNLPLPSGVALEPAADHSGKDLKLRLPNSADLDHVMTLVSHVWHRLVAAIANAQNQVLHRG